MTKPGEAFRAGVVHAIYFQTGSSRSIDLDRALAQVRRVLSSTPGTTFAIEGNTDNVGKEESNQKLSQQRAENVLAFLSSNGIDKAKLSAKGNGPSNPVADNATPAGRALNRRVDVLIK
jgi:outer membrane protein OmpA-like peptidoglycan-associated protein